MLRLARILDLAWPRLCAGCAGPAGGRALCAGCCAHIVAPAAAACRRCLAARPGADQLCSHCRHAAPAFDAIAALGTYRPGRSEDPLVRAVCALKYQGQRAVAEVLGALLAEHYPFDASALLVPVPLHPARLRSRGFNQAALLVRALARHRGLACDLRLLARVRATPAQARLGQRAARLHNLRDAVVVRRPSVTQGRAIVLVDDVVTTGATAHACAQALRQAGATSVAVYVVGRTP